METVLWFPQKAVLLRPTGQRLCLVALSSPGPTKATILELIPEKLKKMGGHGEETASSQGLLILSWWSR